MRKIKRMLSVLLVAVLALGIFALPVYANDANDVTVNIDGTVVVFEGQGPVVVDGRTLIPVRGVFEALGFEVDFDEEARTATLSQADTEIIVTVGEVVFTTNGEEFELDVPAQIIGGRTMLPIRALVESLGMTVRWFEDTRTVVILDELRGFIDWTPNPNAIENQLAMPEAGDPIAIVHTTLGDIYIRLFPQYAPLTVANFVAHAQSGYYDGVIFDRVIENFVNQTGDPTGTGGLESVSSFGVPFGVELSQNLRHIRGAVSMGHFNVMGDVKSHFFFVTRLTQEGMRLDNILLHIEDPDSIANTTRSADFEFRSGDIWPEGMLEWYLEHGGTYHHDFWHPVFGQVFQGMDVVEAIEVAEKDEDGLIIEDVVITSITITEFSADMLHE